MIGQKHLISKINSLILNEHFPKFAIICGPKGSGKKELCSHIAEMLNVFWCVEPDCKVETVRNAINDAYKVYSPTLYVFPDADSMSVQARNSLLKVTEEPPKNAYFIMTLESLENTLPTIRSRAMTFNIDPYSTQELLDYMKYNNISLDEEFVKNFCETPGDVNYLNKVGAHNIYSYVIKVVNNIAVVSGSNAFKISEEIAFKDTDKGFDLIMFLKMFKMRCWIDYLETKDTKFLSGMEITKTALQKCYNKSINKQMVFDTWVLDIREAWIEWK